MSNIIDAIRAELDRLDAGGDDGIEVEAHPAGVRFYDTQESAVYDAAEALAALRAVGPDDINPDDGGGFGAAWNALAHLQEVP
jgi:hypothetical protein